MKKVSLINTKVREFISVLDNQNSQGVLSAELIGSHLSDSLYTHYDFLQYGEYFSQYSYQESTKADTLIIIGVVNRNILPLLKEKVKELSGVGKKVVYISGGLEEKFFKDSYYIVRNLSKEIDIDLEIKQYPLNVGDIVNQLLKMDSERND